jgi:hypothetical protein
MTPDQEAIDALAEADRLVRMFNASDFERVIEIAREHVRAKQPKLVVVNRDIVRKE